MTKNDLINLAYSEFGIVADDDEIGKFIDAVLQTANTPIKPISTSPAAAPVVLPEPDAYANPIDFSMLARKEPTPKNKAWMFYTPHPELIGVYSAHTVRALLAGVSAPAAQEVPDGWREQFTAEVYEDLAAADNQDVPLEEYPSRILKVLDSIVGPRHPVVVKWRNDAIRNCIAIAYKYCRDPESHKYLKQDLEAMLTTEPAPQQADARDALDQSGWVSVDDALPEHAISEVLILQMYFEADGTARMHDKEDPALGYLYNIAKGHCHQDGSVPRWSGRSGDNFGLLFRGGWRVAAWRHIHPASNYVGHIAAIAAAKGNEK